MQTICFSSSSLRLKASLDPSIHSCVDSTLKRLKLLTRRLVTTLAAFQEESRVLDRLFYKGKNQHRTSLFWKHVNEMRRFCNRLQGFDFSARVTRIRYGFYNSTDYQNQTILKLSWTHSPDAKALRAAAQSFGPLRELLLKMLDRLMIAYCSLKRVMQTGAFLQTILTLSAIACRLHALTKIVLEIHEELITTLLDLCEPLEAFMTSEPLRHQSVQLPTESNNFTSFPLVTVSLQQEQLTGDSRESLACESQQNIPDPVATKPIADEYMTSKVDKAIKSPEQPEPLGKNAVPKIKKKKKKTPKNEIDVIFDL